MSDEPGMSWIDSVSMLIHRVLAQHRPYEECPECAWVACRHCKTVGRVGDDHTCTCPFGDDCLNHPRLDRATKENNHE